MVLIPLGKTDYRRKVGDIGDMPLHNRYFEKDPLLSDKEETALIARPGLTRWLEVGEGPIRAVFSQSGVFNDNLFVVSFKSLYKVNSKLKTSEEIYTNLFGTKAGQVVRMVATPDIGSTPSYLFIADGEKLLVYTENGKARANITGSIDENDVLQIDQLYYKFVSGTPSDGTGTSSDPYQVKWEVSDNFTTFEHLAKALDADGVAGVDYSSSITSQNEFVTSSSYSDTSFQIVAREAGVEGNSFPTSLVPGTNGSVSSFSGGGSDTVNTVEVPDDLGAIDVAFVSGHVIVVPVQSEEKGSNGKFFWIEPGEDFIRPLNFATAERSPDPLHGVVVFNDQFWLTGMETTEVWQITGDPNFPVQRLSGVTYDRGTWPGTAVPIHESMIIVDSNGAVFQIGGGVKRISSPDIEERIRKAIQIASFNENFGEQ